jgi:sedoheptulokinase
MIAALTQMVDQIGDRSHEICGIGVTGQMHGVAFLNPDATPARSGITWQDRRADENLLAETTTYLERYIALAGGAQAFTQMGCLPAAGYLGPTLYWLKCHDQLPPSPVRPVFIPDAIAAFLTGSLPCTDSTNGGSSGLFDIVARQWDQALWSRLGLSPLHLPEIREGGSLAGQVLPAIAAATGLPPGTSVFVAVGDNQASFLGSVREPLRAIALNVGIGAQISALVQTYGRLAGLDTRAYFGGQYLLVGAGLFGGNSYAYLRELFRRVGIAFYGQEGDEELYDEMTRSAAAVPAGSDGLRCIPLFTGTRLDPAERAAFTGISPYNFTPGHLTRALLEGIAEEFYRFYEQMKPLLGERNMLVGSGNGIRRNRLLAHILAERFQMPLYLPANEEEAATGAALLAAVGAGAIPSLDAAARMVDYAERVTPA